MSSTNNFIPYGRQNISEEDIQAVTEVLRSNFLTQGPKVAEFEKAVANYCKVDYGVAVNSATSALHIACLALGLGKGDYLWTSPITFVASANCGLYCGAKVDFVDIDPATINMCPDKLEGKLIEAEKRGQLPKIVIPVHFGGQSCDMERIYKLSQKYGFKIIEDASHAIGGSYKGYKVGSCHYSDITVFSFHPVKIITSGEGGMAMTNNEDIVQKMKRLRSHGVTRDESFMVEESHGPWYYEQIDLGFNYRMTDIHAALGISQLRRLDSFVEKRNSLAEMYKEKLTDLPLRWQYLLPNCESAYHLFVVLLEGGDRLNLFKKLRDEGVGVNVHYKPVHTQPFFSKNFPNNEELNNAHNFYEKAITLPLYPAMEEKDLMYIVNLIKGSVL